MTAQRLWEIDFFRGIAITMMVIYHSLFILFFLGDYAINVKTGFWMYFARATAILFLFIVGVSLTLSYSKHNSFRKHLKRGLGIFFWGLIITLTTYFTIGQGYVLFGILHLIGLSIIIAYPFIKLKYSNLLIAIAIIILGFSIKKYIAATPYFVWLGFIHKGFYSLDYFPVFPWFGVVLLGIFAGNLFYKDLERKVHLPNLSHKLTNAFCALGRKSLTIYILHIPLITLFYALVGMIDLRIIF